ncbi:MAG: transposase [Candidatus Endonucleobacter bathymodioli]|uniref:Transposase n=1 Tax=Candidatus Endonucleibacter bathymodioli TaxID=539814 RepID=A0AA90NLC0_9GAMM|nr:transposase [Candidatus Endonucleobacter bathymodioli]
MLIDHDAVKELYSVHELIDWARLEHHLKDIHSSSRGEKAWPPLMMFKALLLQSWYKLSDSALEKQLARDLLFRRFISSIYCARHFRVSAGPQYFLAI